jgi:predicted hotdog family 3-hydroxylacyl-ACP dehydratase
MTHAASLDRAAIAALIPHSGNMCLLNRVQHWDQEHIEAVASDVHSVDNPLRENGELHAVVLVEYAAQAAAAHAALTGSRIGGERAAYIGSIKAMTIHEPTVSLKDDELYCNAHCMLNDTGGAIYKLTVSSQHRTLIEARLVLILP